MPDPEDPLAGVGTCGDARGTNRIGLMSSFRVTFWGFERSLGYRAEGAPIQHDPSAITVGLPGLLGGGPRARSQR